MQAAPQAGFHTVEVLPVGLLHERDVRRSDTIAGHLQAALFSES